MFVSYVALSPGQKMAGVRELSNSPLKLPFRLKVPPLRFLSQNKFASIAAISSGKTALSAIVHELLSKRDEPIDQFIQCIEDKTESTIYCHLFKKIIEECVDTVGKEDRRRFYAFLRKKLIALAYLLCIASSRQILSASSDNIRYMNVGRRKRSIQAIFSSSSGFFCSLDRLLREGKNPWLVAVVTRRHVRTAMNRIINLWDSRKKYPASSTFVSWRSPSLSMTAIS